MPNFYQSDIKSFPDAELDAAEKELLDAGVGGFDDDNYWPDGSWEQQAIDRLDGIRYERDRRWELAHPEEAASRQKMRSRFASVNAFTLDIITPMITDAIFG